MNDISLQILSDLSIAPETGAPELRSIYISAVENLDLQAIDYLTIRDLVTLSGTNDTGLHLLLIALFLAMREGSVCLKLDPESLKKKLSFLPGGVAEAHIRAVIRGAEISPALVHVKTASQEQVPPHPREEFKPLILVEGGEGRFLYFQKYYRAEELLIRALSDSLGRTPPVPVDPEKLGLAIRDVLHDKPVLLGGVPAQLNDGQKLGLLLPVMNDFALISGGPGTGKTFIVLTLVRILVRLGIAAERIKIAAPTGRAAQKLTESIRRGLASIRDRDAIDDSLASLLGTTIHRLLGYSPSRNDFIHNRFNKIRADLIIVDEASMIDIVLQGRLFEAIGDGVRLVMLGDRDQLPSVDAGAVLADLIPDESTVSFSPEAIDSIHAIFPDIRIQQYAGKNKSHHVAGPLENRVVILRESYRSGERIQAIARKIIAQDESVLTDIPGLSPIDQFPEHGAWLMEPGSSGEPPHRELRRILDTWTSVNYEAGGPGGASFRSLISASSGSDLERITGENLDRLKKIIACLDEARILTPVRAGIAGTSGINAYTRSRLGEKYDPVMTGTLFSGAPVMILKNDYGRELFNGDVGVILRDDGGRYHGVFTRHDGIVTYPADTLPSFDLSYAITVHKSQGSEYDRVLLILPDGLNDALCTREILYTGLTRAKSLVVIYASRATLLRAIRNRTERESGIRFMR
ncbi:MAG: exodeoxyribonuclease V subunit alpha [Spirochaetes bacterium]|nr:exodeoxyribonuclease V subunit alpha [Spirochaetota bacterium]